MKFFVEISAKLVSPALYDAPVVHFSSIMDRISSLLPQVLKKRGLHKHATASLTVQQAQEWLGKKLPKFIRDLHVTSFKDGTVTVSCAHSIAAQECQQVVQELAAYLRDACHVRDLADVRCVRE